MDSIDPRIIEKAKKVNDDETTVIDIVRVIGERLEIDENTALKRLIEVIVSNPTLDFYDRVATLGPFPHIRYQVISNAMMGTRLRITVQSGWNAVAQYFPDDTCRLTEVRIAKDKILSALDNLLPKWLNEIKWIPKPSKRVGKPSDKDLQNILDKAYKYAEEYYGNIKNNPISCNKLIRTKDFIDAVFLNNPKNPKNPKKKFLKIGPKENDRYREYYCVGTRSIVGKITPLKEKSINRKRKT